MTWTTAYIGLGSNLGDRQQLIDSAVQMLSGTGGIEVIGRSDTIETRPLSDGGGPDYLNIVAEVRTKLSADELLKAAKGIEKALGRTSSAKWSARTMDLDLLLYGQETIDSPDLTVPHLQLHLRTFVLAGLCQLNPQLVHPVLEQTVSVLASRLNGQNFEVGADVPRLVSIAGVIGVGKTTLAGKLSEQFDCDLLFEPYDTNPFMPDVYAGCREMALDSQLYFLTERVEQLSCDSLTPGRLFISDYIFDKEWIYADRLLDSRQLELYKRVYNGLCHRLTAPVLVIYLRGSAQLCLDRIVRRNRPYEQKIDLAFLQALDGDYERLFDSWRLCPVIQLSAQQGCDIENLAGQIKRYTDFR